MKYRIKKGLSAVTDILDQPIYVRFPYIQLDLQSVRSHLGFYLTQLMKNEMQDTASNYRKDEVWEYLIDNYELKDLQYLMSYTHKEYRLDDRLILAYASMQAKDVKLKQDLHLISTVLSYQNTMQDIESLLASIKNNTRPMRISPAGYIVDGHIEYRPKYDVTKSTILETAGNTKVETKRLHEIYYKYLSKLAGVENNDWVFIEGLTRTTESHYLEAILEGHIRATTQLGLKIQDALFTEQKTKGKNLIYIETLQQRLDLADETNKQLQQQGYELRGLNDFVMYYGPKPEEGKARQKHEVDVLTGVYVWDYDNEEELPVINRLLGLTGEYSRINRSNSIYPTYIYDNTGELIEMWRVEDTYDIAFEDMRKVPVKITKQMSPKVSTLYHADKLTSNKQQLKNREVKRYITQLEVYYKYTHEYHQLYQL